MTELDFHPNNPFLPLDWRWQLATVMVRDSIRANRRRHDGWVLRCRRFQQAISRDEDGRRLLHLDPELYVAQRIRLGADRARDVLEAWLLAGQDDQEISSRCAVPAGAVTAYERAFYDVRRLLASPGALVLKALGSRFHTGGAGDEDIYMKHIAIFGGPFALEAVLDTFYGPPTSDPETLHVRALVRLSRAARALPIDVRLFTLFPELGGLDWDDLVSTGVPSGPVLARLESLVATLESMASGDVADDRSHGRTRFG
jgi:hypothetical protein